MVSERDYYYLDDEKMRMFISLSTEQKLDWLEEIIELSNNTLTPKQKEIRNKFRQGEI